MSLLNPHLSRGIRPILALGATVATIVLGTATVARAQEALWTDGGRGSFGPDDPVTFGAFAELAADASPAVVNIDVSVQYVGSMYGYGGMEMMGQGTGFIIRADGLIVTNNHVVESATSIAVTLDDGRQFPASVLGTDPRTDLALLRIAAGEELPILRLGDSSDVRVGDWVVAIGNPLGLDHTVTAGIVSALERRDIRPEGRVQFTDYIQTDAAINPGNSGGPLIDINGNVIGVNSALQTGNNLGFAIPINMVKALLPQLFSGQVERAWLGVRLQTLTPELARQLEMDAPHGALVAQVVPGSPADEAGVEPGDVIVEFNGESVDDEQELPWLASIAGVGAQVSVELLRAGETVELDVTMGAQPGQSPPSQNTSGPRSGQAPQVNGGSRTEGGGTPQAESFGDLGFAVGPVDSDVAEGLGIAGGVVVTSVAPGSGPALAGLLPGDVITHMGSDEVDDVEDFERISSGVSRGELVRLRLRRGALTVFIGFSVL